MIDDATAVCTRALSGTTARPRTCRAWSYLEQFGRPLAFYTDKAAMFETAAKKRAAANEEQKLAPTQITRALMEPGIERISAHGEFRAQRTGLRLFTKKTAASLRQSMLRAGFVDAVQTGRALRLVEGRKVPSLK